MLSEIVFIIHCVCISLFALISLIIGKYALVAFVCLQCILANIFVIKQTMLFGLHATCADAYTVGAVLGLNLLQEYFGKNIAAQTIFINFVLLIFYTIVSQIHLWYNPSPFDFTQDHFQALLHFMPRIMVASIFVYLISQLLEYVLYGFLKKTWKNKYLVIRNYVSILFCQLVDTVLFSFLGLYGIVENIGQVIVISYIVKVIAIFLAAPSIYFSKPLFLYLHQSDKG